MRHSRSRRAAPAMISVLAAFGAVLCTGQMTASAQSAPDDLAVGQLISVGGDIVAEVVANGSGCPAGTWAAEIAADGTTFNLKFDQYEATVSPQAALDVQSCQVAISLNGTLSKSYAIALFSYEGRAVLSAGVEGKFTTTYYFQGSPEDGQRMEDEQFVGPLQRHFTIVDSIELDDLNWSPCGAQIDLNVQTNIVLNNTSGATGSGAIYLTSIEEGPGSVVLRLAARDC